VRALTATWLCALALTRAGTSGAAAVTTTDTRFANYAFASELGSGIYEISGRTVQVYQLQPSYLLRPASPHGSRPGINLIFPVTVGFFNFQPTDLIHLHVPTHIGALSLEPGVELDYWLSDAWHVYPYIKAGGTFASSTQINALIYRRWRNRRPTDVVAWHQQVQADLIKTLRDRPDDWFGRRDRSPDWPSDFVGHSAWHRIRDIEAALRP